MSWEWLYALEEWMGLLILLATPIAVLIAAGMLGWQWGIRHDRYEEGYRKGLSRGLRLREDITDALEEFRGQDQT